MKIRTNVKAGAFPANHNETQVSGLRVKTRVRAGALGSNHNEALVSDRSIK